MLRRLGLGSLLVAGAISLASLNQFVGILFIVFVVVSPCLVAALLNGLPIGADSADDR